MVRTLVEKYDHVPDYVEYSFHQGFYSSTHFELAIERDETEILRYFLDMGFGTEWAYSMYCTAIDERNTTALDILADYRNLYESISFLQNRKYDDYTSPQEYAAFTDTCMLRYLCATLEFDPAVNDNSPLKLSYDKECFPSMEFLLSYVKVRNTNKLLFSKRFVKYLCLRDNLSLVDFILRYKFIMGDISEWVEETIDDADVLLLERLIHHCGLGILTLDNVIQAIENESHCALEYIVSMTRFTKEHLELENVSPGVKEYIKASYEADVKRRTTFIEILTEHLCEDLAVVLYDEYIKDASILVT